LGRLRHSPRLLAGFEGLTSKRKEGKGENCYKGEGKGARKGTERRKRKGKGGKERRCAVGIFNYFRLWDVVPDCCTACT